MTAEYRFLLIGPTLLAVPRRRRVLPVVAAVTFVAAFVATPVLLAAKALVLLARIVPGKVWPQRIERYAPMTAGLTMSWHGFAVLAGYAAAALAGGAVRLSRDLRW